MTSAEPITFYTYAAPDGCHWQMVVRGKPVARNVSPLESIAAAQADIDLTMRPLLESQSVTVRQWGFPHTA